MSLFIDGYDGVAGCGDGVDSLVALSISLRAGVHGGDGNRDAIRGSMFLVCSQQLNPSDGCGFESDAHSDTTRERVGEDDQGKEERKCSGESEAL